MGFFLGNQERVRHKRGKRAISVRATEVLLYIDGVNFTHRYLQHTISGLFPCPHPLHNTHPFIPRPKDYKYIFRALDMREYLMIIFLISHRNHML